MAIKYPEASGNYSTTVWLDAPGGNVVAAPTDGDEIRLNGKTIAINVVRVPATSGILTSINAKDVNGAQTAGNLTCNLTTVGADVSIFATNMVAGTVSLLVSAGATNRLTIDCTGGTLSGSAGSGVRGMLLGGSHPWTFIGSLAAGGVSLSNAIRNENTGLGTMTVVNITGGYGASTYNCTGILCYFSGDVTCTATGNISGNGTLTTGQGNGGIQTTGSKFTLNGGNLINTIGGDAFNSGIWNPSETSYVQFPTTAGTIKLRPETSVAAATKVLSGEPRWTGATGADIGTLPYTRKRGALR